MSFDWIDFFDAHSISYNITGPNVSAGNVAIRCPICANDDDEPEYRYLSVSLHGHGWWCFKKHHGGKSPENLVQALLGCSREQAQRITGGIAAYLPANFLEQVNNHLNPPPKRQQSTAILKLPKEFKPLTCDIFRRPSSYDYLLGRDFSEREISLFTDKYDIRYCTIGPFQKRIIFPIHMHGKLVTWTGRTIFKYQKQRYKTLTTDPEKAFSEGSQPAIESINSCLLWYDDLKRTHARSICLCEGPFDALRIRTLGKKVGVTSTCFFTSGPSDAQIELLHEILPKFERRYLLLDQTAFARAMEVQASLHTLNVVTKQLPQGIKDPGELSAREFHALNVT